jgi:hypothetical protein
MHSDVDRIIADLWQAEYEQDAREGTRAQEGEDQEGEETKYFVDINIYPIKDRPAPQQAVEGSLAEATQEQQDEEDSFQPDASGGLEEEIAPGETRPPRRPSRLHPATMVCIAAWLLLAISIGAWYEIMPLFTPKATVTIVPVSREVTATGTLTVVTGKADAARNAIPGRLLSTITMSQATSVPTTGTGHQDAQSAQGTITFYNAAPYPQTISAGTVLNGADGVEVVTDSEAIIPAGQLSTNGQATVSAHALTAGPGGNIRAGDIYGKCCREDVLASNSAFSGGQLARTYPMVTADDISAAARQMQKSLSIAMQAAFQPQVRDGETLITPLPCTPTITPDHQVGAEARLVQVTVSLSCTGEVYQTSVYQAAVAQMVTRAAAQQPGAGYDQSGTIQASITRATYRPHGAVALTVKAAGTWTYQISQAERSAIAQSIEDKSRAQATAFLLTMPGVQSAAIQITRGDQLPGDASRIQVIVVAYAA